MKTLIVNWFNTFDESQAFYVDLKEAIFAEEVNYDRALNGTNMDFTPDINDGMFAFYGSMILSDYVKNHEDLYEIDGIVGDDLALSNSNLKTPLFAVCDVPYLDIAQELNKNGVWNKAQLWQKGNFYADMQKNVMINQKKKCVGLMI